MAEKFKLILITPEKNVRDEAAKINAMFDAGLQMLHIRKPAQNTQEVKSMVLSISPAFHSKIVLHSHYELLKDFNLKGVHLPEKIREEGNIHGMQNIVSSSFHVPEDMMRKKINLEYAFFSPVFKSISKPGYRPSKEVNYIKEFLIANGDNIGYPVIALGGITDKNILLLPDMGFSGAACIGYIWESSEPVNRLKRLQALTGN